jgi:hypothetical protein
MAHSQWSDFPDPEDELLGGGQHHTEGGSGPDHAVRTAPVFTKQALGIIGESVLPQRALYGSVLAQRAPGFSESIDTSDAKLYINTNAPFSGVVCGVQVRATPTPCMIIIPIIVLRDPERAIPLPFC